MTLRARLLTSLIIASVIIASLIKPPRTTEHSRAEARTTRAAPLHAIAVLTRGYADLAGYDQLIARNRAITLHVLPKLTAGAWDMLIFHEVFARPTHTPRGVGERVSTK